LVIFVPGFSFISASFSQSQPASWEERFEELVKYKEEHGNCQVQKNVPTLGQWVKQQRKEYRYYVQGSKPSRMTQERIAKLSSIGFDFGEQRWNTGKMKQAHAAIEKGRAQESSLMMMTMNAANSSSNNNNNNNNIPLMHLPGVGGGVLGDGTGVVVEGASDDDDQDEDPASHHHLQQVLDQRTGGGFRHLQPMSPWDRYRPFNM
jgi:Helicase associated domain